MKKMILITAFFISANAIAQSNEWQLGMTEFQKNNWKAAQDHFKKYLISDPNDYKSLLFLGMSEAKQKEYTEAINFFLKIFTTDVLPEQLNEPRFQLARIYASLNDENNAIHYLKEAVNNGANISSRLQDSAFSSINTKPEFAAIVEESKTNSSPCMYNENSRKLDFFIGVWDVYVGNNFSTKVAVDTIFQLSNGCMLLENFKWTAGGNYSGHSMTFYDFAGRKLRQSWAGSSGDVINYEESKLEDNMVQFTGITTTNTLKDIMYRRMTITYNPKDKTVHELIENSYDLGKSWSINFEAMFKKQSI